MQQNEQIEHIAKHYGEWHQLDKTLEELYEIAQAIVEYQKAKKLTNATKNLAAYSALAKARNYLAEKIADVTILLEQDSFLTGLGKEVQIWRQKKLDSQMKRIQDEKASKNE